MKTLFLVVFIFVSGFMSGAYKKEISSELTKLNKSLKETSLMKRAENLMKKVQAEKSQKKHSLKNSSAQERNLDIRWVYAKKQKEFNPENNARCAVIQSTKGKNGKFLETFCQGNKKLQKEVHEMIASKN